MFPPPAGARKVRRMGQVIDFESTGVATMRRRVAAMEEAQRDLIAFARGHAGAVSAVHAAVLAAADAEGADHLVHIVTQTWPDLLGVDAVAFAAVHGARGWRGDASGLQEIAPRVVERAAGEAAGVVLHGVARGHPLFGPARDLIRAEAVVRLEGPAPVPVLVLLLGQRAAPGFDTRHGSEPLLFLGRFLARMMVRWLPR